ncbi:MAG: glutaredoxin family protein [Clostridium sp.]|nr:glutaredoxin family protein [Clostridium sp.]
MDKKVVIYTSLTCPYCELAKEYFAKNEIKYEEKSTTVPENRKKLMEIGVRTVPTIFVDDEYMVGFEEEEFEALYNK